MYSEELKHIAPYVGLYCCRNDRSLTLLNGAGSLVELSGYGTDAWESELGGSMASLICAAERDKYLDMLASQLSRGDSVEFFMPIRRRDGAVIWVLNRGRRVRDGGEDRICGILADVTRLECEYERREKAAMAFRRKAENDSLTHVYNAATARHLAEEYIDGTEGGKAALLVIDLDDFKLINDNNGHMAGDAVLVQTAQIIKRLFRTDDVVGRIGGDEFMVLMKDTTDRNIIEKRCRKINADLETVFADRGMDGIPSCSIGIAILPDHADSYFHLFRCADSALYCAKDRGKKQFAFYDHDPVPQGEDGMTLRYMDYDENMLYGYRDRMPADAINADRREREGEGK